MTAAVGQGREGAAAAQEKLKPDEKPEVDHEETAQTVQGGKEDSKARAVHRNAESDTSHADGHNNGNADLHLRQGVVGLVAQEEQHAQDSDRVRDTDGDSDLPGVESGDRVVSKTIEPLPAASLSAVDSTVSNRSVSSRQKAAQKPPETVLSQPACDTTLETTCDSTVSRPLAKVVSLLEVKRKKACDSTVAKDKKRGVTKAESAPKPKAIKGHEWRRQGTGWTLLRSWYERDETGVRARRREYVQHYSATALRRAETLRRKML